MRRRAIGLTLAGVGVLAARALAPRLHAPDGGLRAHVRAAARHLSAQADAAGHRGDPREQRADLALLEAREQRARPRRAARLRRPERALRHGRNEEGDLAAIGASARGSDA